MSERGPRVVIADDQSLVRAGFRMILDAQPDMSVVAAVRLVAAGKTSTWMGVDKGVVKTTPIR